MSRPPSARPKTSAGSRAASAKGVRRPSTTARNVQERPASRTAMVTDGSANDRAVSRSGLQPPRSSVGERLQSRMGTAIGGRPPTGFSRPPPSSSAHRPVTQQGLTGVRQPSRLGTMVSGRQVFDKAYYLALLRAKTGNITNEIEKLKEELERGERDRQNLLIFEKRAEEEANAIRNLQGRLKDLNLIVDRLNTNSDLSELEEELHELRVRNEEAEAGVEELFAERRNREEEIREVERLLENERANLNATRSNMDPHLQEEYEQLKAEGEQLAEEYRLRHEVLEELTRRKVLIDEELANSNLKQQAMVLLERLTELEAKKASIEQEINAEGSPDEQRERLLQTVLRTTDEINAIQKQIEAVNEQIDQGNEELREFESEYESLAGEKNEKYRELRMKEMQIDEFLDSYASLKAEHDAQIAQLSDRIVRNLQLISLNCAKVDEGAGTDPEDAGRGASVLGNDALSTASVSELQEMHVRLQEELIAVNEKISRLSEERENAAQRGEQLRTQMLNFDDLDALRADIDAKKRGLEERRAELESELPELIAASSAINDQLVHANVWLDNNDNFAKLRNAQKKWQFVEESNAAIREAVAARDAEVNYANLKEEALHLQSEYNALLILFPKPTR